MPVYVRLHRYGYTCGHAHKGQAKASPVVLQVLCPLDFFFCDKLSQQPEAHQAGELQGLTSFFLSSTGIAARPPHLHLLLFLLLFLT